MPDEKPTILLVDDEESIRNVAEMMLKTLGFGVITAADGFQALKLYHQQGEEISLVLLDLSMPRMDGEEVLQKLREMNPAVRVIMATGMTDDDTVAYFEKLGVDGFAKKPYLIEELLNLINRAISS